MKASEKLSKQKRLEAKIKKESQKLLKAEHAIRMYGKINTALPKRKAQYFDKLAEPHYNQRIQSQFNLTSHITELAKLAGKS